MSNGNDKQQPGQQGAGPIKVKALYFLALEGVLLGALRAMEGQGRITTLFAGKHPRRNWTTEIVREPWHRMYRVTEIESGFGHDGKGTEVRTVLVPESAASYVPEVA